MANYRYDIKLFSLFSSYRRSGHKVLTLPGITAETSDTCYKKPLEQLLTLLLYRQSLEVVPFEQPLHLCSSVWTTRVISNASMLHPLDCQQKHHAQFWGL